MAAATTGTDTCAVMITGGLRCWGDNTGGQLGNGSMVGTSAPVATDVLTGLKAVTLGNTTDGVGYPTGGHVCALTTSGGVRCWGSNTYGELGNGTTDGSLKPPAVDVLTDVKAIAAGDAHTCALTNEGGLRCWGDNLYGQLGYPTDSYPHPSPPTQDLLSNIQAIAIGEQYTCAVTASGGARCWGYNGTGELGDGTTSKIDQ